MKKVVALFLAMIMLVSLCACAGTSGDTAKPTESAASDSQEPVESTPAAEAGDTSEKNDTIEKSIYPLVDEQVTLTMFATTNNNVTNVIGELQNHSIYNEAVDITGVYIKFNAQTMETANTSFSLMFASGEFTDMFKMPGPAFPNGISACFDDGFIVDIADHLENAPNYNSVISATDTISRDVRTDNGNILEFFLVYTLNGGYKLNVANGPVLRGDLLDKLEMELPRTYDEYHDVLLAFKTEFDLADPFYVATSNIAEIIGGSDVSSSFYQIDGAVHYGPYESNTRDYLEMFTQWYSEGLINQDFFNYEPNPMAPANEAIKLNSAGLYYCSPTDLDNYNNKSENPDFKLVGGYDVAGEDGINHFGQDTFNVKPTGIAISTTCSDIELAVKWCDFWYGEQGVTLANYGLEGVSLQYDTNGDPHWTDWITNNPEGYSYSIARQVYLVFTQQPTLYKQDMEYELYSDAAAECIERWKESYDGAYLMPTNYSLTAEESTRAANIMSDIQTLNEETWLKLVIGEISFDAYDKYIADMKDLGIEEAISIYQTALDRYYER